MIKANNYFELFFENSIDLLCIIDTKGYFKKVNSEWNHTLGYTNDDLEGKQYTEFIHPDDIEKTLSIAKEQSINKSRVSKFVNRYRHKDGSYRWIEWRSFFVDDLVYASARDITKTVEIENELSEKGKLLNGIAKNVPGIVFQFYSDENNQWGLSYVSDSANNFLELDTKKLEGYLERFVDLMPVEEQKEFIKSINDAVGLKYSWSYQGKFVQKSSGETKYFSAKSEPRILGNKLVFDGILLDITKQKKDEEEVKRLLELHQTILDTASVGIVNIKNRKVQWANDAYFNMFGYSADRLHDIPPTLSYKDENDYNIVGEEGYTVLSKGLIFNTKVEAKKADGSYIWVSLSGKAINPYDLKEGSIWVIQDITGNVNSEIELQKSEAILKSTIESISDTILVVDEKGKVTHYNSSFKKLFDLPESLLQNNDDQILINKAKSKLKDPDSFAKKIIEIYKTKEITEDILEFIDGRIIERLSFPLHKDSPVNGRVWLFRDITERKLMEENLLMFKYSIDYAMDSILWLNKDGEVDYANEQACKSLGYTHDEIKKIKLYDFDPLFSKERFDKDWDFFQFNRQGGGVNVESINKRKDGTTFPVEVISKHLWVNEKELHVAHIRDITERKQYEAALEKRVLALTRPVTDLRDIKITDLFSIEDLQKIQDAFAKATGVASIITFPDGKPITKPTNFCSFCNLIRSTKKGVINCYKSDAYIGRNNPSGPIIQPCLSGGLWDAGASIALEGVHLANWLIGQVRDENVDEEKILKYADEIGVDKEKFLKTLNETKQMPREQFDNISNALFILANELSLRAYQNVQQARFISEQKKAEEEARLLNMELEKKVVERTKKIFEANQDLESFAYSVSHDLRAPLRHIDGYTRLLYTGIDKPSESVINYYNKVKDSVSRMSQMIDDLLSFSRLGRKTVDFRKVSINTIVNEIIQQYEQLPDKFNIKWIIDELPDVSGDKNMLRLVFDNLISNAVKYSSKKDEIIVEIGAIGRNDKVEFFVKDNGVGFDMRYSDKLFNVFQRLHSNDEFEGVGIGLANVKQIVNKHTGQVRAESELNKGATFFISLPI